MTDTTALPSYDILAPGDPLSRLLHVAAESPLCWIPDLNAYLVTRHADIVAALKDRRLATANLTQGFDRLSPEIQEELRPLRLSLDLWMGHTTEDGHHRFQQLLKRYFTPATMNTLRPRVRELAGELLDARQPQGRMDVVSDLAYPLPANIIADMFGMPAGDRGQLRTWSQDIEGVFHYADADALRASQRSVLEMQDYLRRIVADRRVHPQDDLISMFVAAERDGVVDEDEIVANCVLLLFAGHETTAILIANGLALLMAHPDQLALLKSRPELTVSAVEEMLRCDGPVVSVVRESTEPVTVAGQDFGAGELFYLAVYAGNHDPAVFPDPARFDITRAHNRHVGFGIGTYYCLGAALARVEAGECFRLLLERLPGIRPAANEDPQWTYVPPMGGRRFDTLPVEF